MAFIRSRIDFYRPEDIGDIGANPDTIRSAALQMKAGAASKGISLSERALLSCLAVSGLETYYGRATKPAAWVGTNNWGAIQCSHGAPCGDSCFESVDHRADGREYHTCFKRYSTPEEGAGDLVSLLVRRIGMSTLDKGDPDALAHGMKQAGYFEAPETAYASAVRVRMAEVREALGGGYPSNPVATSSPGQGDAAGQGGGIAILLGAGLLGALYLRRAKGRT